MGITSSLFNYQTQHLKLYADPVLHRVVRGQCSAPWIYWTTLVCPKWCAGFDALGAEPAPDWVPGICRYIIKLKTALHPPTVRSEDPGSAGTSAQAGNEAIPEKKRSGEDCSLLQIKPGFHCLCTLVSGAVFSLRTCCSLNSSFRLVHSRYPPLVTLCFDRHPAVHCSGSELNNLRLKPIFAQLRKWKRAGILHWRTVG